MVDKGQFFPVFERLKGLLLPYRDRLRLTSDTEDGYELNTPFSEKWHKELLFAATQIKKNYVSFYLLPVYMFPDLLQDISPGLIKRMQGKSCFNFRSLDESLLEELRALTDRSYERMKREGLV